VWVLPVLALALGVIIVFAKIRNLEKAPEPKTAAAESAAPAETPEEDPYLARVRKLVKGDNS
jgi:cytochrome c-type biogenesis protein CcmH/NrfF